MLSSDNMHFLIYKSLKQNLEQKYLEAWHYPILY